MMKIKYKMLVNTQAFSLLDLYRSRSMDLHLIILALATSVSHSGDLKNHVMFCQYDLRVRHTFTVEDIPVEFCTDVLVGFFSNDPTLQTLIHDADKAAVKSVEEKLFPIQRRTSHLKLHLTVGRPGTTPRNRDLLPIVKSDKKADEFIDRIMKYLRGSSYQGVNVYWQTGGTSDNLLLGFLRNMDTKFQKEMVGDTDRARKWYITVTLSAYPVTGLLDSTNIYSIHNFIDYLILKAFNHTVDSKPMKTYTHPQYLRYEDETNSQLDYLEQTHSVTWLQARGVPPEKLVVGYPTYARALIIPPQGTPKHLRYPNSIYNKTVIVSRREACRIFKKRLLTWNTTWDNRWNALYLTHRNGKYRDWLFFGGIKAIKNRCTWLLHNHFSGLMVWTLDQDDTTADCSFVTFPITRYGFYCLKIGEGFRHRKARSTGMHGSAHETNYYIMVGMGWFFFLWFILLYWYLVPNHWRWCDDDFGL